MVFYRKYRPQTIDELDSEEIRKSLYSVLSGLLDKRPSSGRALSVPHAFLFSGPRGLGKTSTARIVAKAINCEKLNTNKSKKVSGEKLESGSIEPCNKCDQCISITNGSNLDVLEIDGASNRGIDEIRDLREKVRLLPVSASKKVYIIDEVHMLTTEAFNALLKTLEEPPAHAIFILCTTELQKVPETILSRCFRLQFKLATKNELIRSFSRIAKNEGIKIDEEALDCLVDLSDGSFRDGVKVLEEISLACPDKKITKEILEERYKITSIKNQVSQMITIFSNRQAKEGLNFINGLVSEGVNMKFFIEELVSDVHKIMLSRVGVGEVKDDFKLKIEEIKELMQILTRAYGELKYAVLPQLPLELALVEFSLKKNNRQVTSSANVKNDGKEEIPQFIDSENIWPSIIEKVKPFNHSVAGVLRGCRLVNFDGKKLTIEASYKFHKERLEEPKAAEIIKKTVNSITGKNIEVNVCLKNQKSPV